MTLKQLAAKAFDEGQRIRLTAVPLKEKEIKGNMPTKKKPFKTVLEEKYEALKSVNVSLSQANKELQDVIDSHVASSSAAYGKKRELEVRIEGMVAEVKGARAEAELLKGANKELANKIASLLNTLDDHIEIIHQSDEDIKSVSKQIFKANSERDTLSRLLKIIKAAANGITLDGEDRVYPMEGDGVNG